MKTKQDRKRYYSKLYAQAVSPCGGYLAVGGTTGKIALIDLDTCLNCKETEEEVRSRKSVKGRIPYRGSDLHTTPRIFTSTSTPSHYLCGDSEGRVCGYEWGVLREEGVRNGVVEPSFSFSVTQGGTTENPAEVNVLRVTADQEKLLTGGAGDNNLRLWNLETRQMLNEFSGHTDYVHNAVFRNDREVFSASEDGSVRLWDVRSGHSELQLNPGQESKCQRNLGHWISCLAVDENWVICGGGPSLSMWHLSSMSLAVVMDDGDMEHRDILVMDDKIIDAGNKSKLYHWNFRGDLVGEVPTSMSTTYRINLNKQSEKYQILTTVGGSSKVDFFIDPNYKAFSVETW